MPLRKQQLSEGHICGKLPLPIFGDVRRYIKLYTPTVKKTQSVSFLDSGDVGAES